MENEQHNKLVASKRNASLRFGHDTLNAALRQRLETRSIEAADQRE